MAAPDDADRCHEEQESEAREDRLRVDEAIERGAGEGADRRRPREDEGRSPSDVPGAVVRDGGDRRCRSDDDQRFGRGGVHLLPEDVDVVDRAKASAAETSGTSGFIFLENMRGLLRSGMTERDVREDAIEPTR